VSLSLFTQDRARLQFLQQHLGVDEIAHVEALGEPFVDFGKHRACFVAAGALAQYSGKAAGRA